MGYIIEKGLPCIKELVERTKGGDYLCASSDAMAIYEQDEGTYDSFCYSCNTKFYQEDLKEVDIITINGDEVSCNIPNSGGKKRKKQSPITDEENAKILARTEIDKTKFRGIAYGVNKRYGTRTEYDENGIVLKRYYPVTENKKLVGYKVRVVADKYFYSIGKTGADTDMHGQCNFKAGGKFLVITSGECFTKDTQIMTQRGWVSFGDVLPTDLVMQVNEDSTGELVKPISHIKKEFNGTLIESSNSLGNFGTLTTPDHQMVAVNFKGNWYKHSASEGPTSRFHKIPLTCKVNGKGINLTNDQIALYLAISADSKINKRKTMSDYVHFELQKPRKIERLKGLLGALGIKYNSHKPKDALGRDKTSFNLRLPSWCLSKELPPHWVTDATLEQRRFILEELIHWDGNLLEGKDAFEFSAKEEEHVDWVQALAHTAGYYAKSRRRHNKLGVWYAVRVSRAKTTATWQHVNRKEVLYNGEVYCVSVPSGMILTKYKGNITVVGNCDTKAAYEMFVRSQSKRGQDQYEPMPVVSPSTSETSSLNNFKHNYEFINSFDKVVVCFDEDEKGQQFAKKALDVLPRGKTFLMSVPKGCKDPNEVLQKGFQDSFVSSFWNAQPQSPSGILTSAELFDYVLERAKTSRIPLPPFLKKLETMLCGGIPLGYIANILSSSGCVDADTEFMTKEGWKRIADYKEGDDVLQFHDNNESSFVKPNEFIKLPAETLTRVKTRHLDMCLSDEHRVVYRSRGKNQNHTSLCWMEVKHRHNNTYGGFNGHIPTGFTHQGGDGLDISEGELRLQVAVMADGRVVKEGKGNYTQMRFSKERKYLRLIEMCEKFGLKYKDNGCSYKPKYKNNKEYEVIVWPMLSDKKFDSKYYNCSKLQLEIIMDEMFNWDGYEKHQNHYTTTCKESAEFAQFVFHALGHRASINLDKRVEKYSTGYCATVSFHKQKTTYTQISRSSNTGVKPKIEEFKTTDGFKYCFSVPSGMLVLRRNGHIFCTGNSGKSTIVNELLYYWIFNCEHKTGVVSLEATAGEYYTNILSRHLGRKIELIPTPEEKVAYLSSPDVRKKEEELRYDDDGVPRFYLLDDRGDVSSLKKKIEYLIVGCDCKVLIIDVLQDVLDELPTEEEAKFMRWMKQMVALHEVSFININHARKSQGGAKANSRGAELSEEDMAGSSTIFKSGAINIIITRDKLAEDPIERNTSQVVLSKARGCGNTGSAGAIYYENKTHTLFDLEDYLENYAGTPPAYDTKLSEEAFAFDGQEDVSDVDVPFNF